MRLTQLLLSRRAIAVAVALIGTVSLAIGAHAALSLRSLDAARAAAKVENPIAAHKAARLALVIGNGRYPDAGQPLVQPINDARALSAVLRRDGFDVDLVEDATHDDIARAVGRLKAKIGPDSVALLFFGGYGIQVRGDSYMIPVDAKIWREQDVRRQGISIESVLQAMKDQGARARLAVIDASRRNPYERRFRAYSHGLAPIVAPDHALILSSSAPDKVVDDSRGTDSVLVTELLNQLDAKAVGAETAFNQTSLAVSRASGGEQVPAVSASLPVDVRLGTEAVAAAGS
jgi:uncharacterized caspase-like protein